MPWKTCMWAGRETANCCYAWNKVSRTMDSCPQGGRKTVREGEQDNKRGLCSCLMAEELSLKPMTELLGLALSVAFTICISVSGAVSPSNTNFAPKNQCRLHAQMFRIRK